jgi:hypothetical protein
MFSETLNVSMPSKLTGYSAPLPPPPSNSSAPATPCPPTALQRINERFPFLLPDVVARLDTDFAIIAVAASNQCAPLAAIVGFTPTIANAMLVTNGVTPKSVLSNESATVRVTDLFCTTHTFSSDDIAILQVPSLHFAVVASTAQSHDTCQSGR